ncbi:hypothetical protein CKAH01_16556 [Colletotrichum kahawae]|uniref:F-box domain-containing protein n=1 Tax=Colletotrichum kahawae TaxID=34407 RepID=A0AAD9YEZ6_COLKA|nr:hypothetical protein CKAH01_16556 [Colletotrichum kahawae]
MEALEPIAYNKLAIWDLPIEILQGISCSLDSKDHLRWALVSRWFSSVLCQRLVPNAVARDESDAFIWASRTGHLDIMRQCIDLGMSPRLVWFKPTKGPQEHLPMVGVGLLSGQVDAVRLLMSRGAKLKDLPRKGSSDRRSPLYYVRHTSTLRFLLEGNPGRYTSPDAKDDLFDKMVRHKLPDEVLLFAVENSVCPIDPRTL